MSAPGRTLTVAVAQPRPFGEAHSRLNVAAAVEAVGRAARAGAKLVLFPEGYPGPLRAAVRFDATTELAAAAAQARITICWSRVEAGLDGRFETVAHVHGPAGEERLRYVRSHPATGDVHPRLNGAAMTAGGRIAAPFEVDGVSCGLLICSELWLPEIARVLAVGGAELLLAPAGGGFGVLAANWQLIARARAIENQAYVALTQNLFAGEAGSALIAGPEGEVASRAEEGLLIERLDLDRVRWLRSQDDSMAEPKRFRSLPGLLRARRPELYASLVEPGDGLYDYDAAARSPMEVRA